MNNNNFKFLMSVVRKVMQVVVLTTVSVAAYSELSELTDSDLGNYSGQAIFKLEETATESVAPDQAGITFSRLTLGLKVELNATIDRISLGRYHRNPGTNCWGSGKFCDSAGGDQYSKWNCTNSQCGGAPGDNDYSAGALVYGDLIGLSGGEKFEAAFANITGNPYAKGASFYNSAIFPSGFEYTSDTDLSLRDVTMGRVLADNTLEDFVMEKPWVEFAYEGAGAAKQIVGFRTGFASASGTQGNAIDVFSGFAQPIVTATADAGGLLGSGTFSFAPYLGGVRTPGYIDSTKSAKVGGCSGSFIICDSVKEIDQIAEASPQAQLFPLQQLKMNDSPTFWLSFQAKDIQYNPERVVRNGENVVLNYEKAQAGVWFNIGALSVFSNGNQVSWNDMANYTGVVAAPSRPKHPDNYFTSNPNSFKYPQSNNYY